MSSSRSPLSTARDAKTFLAAARIRIDAYLDHVLPPVQGNGAALAEAMRYSVLAGGKRIRPALVMASALAVEGDPEKALPFGAAVELVHTYSLIHDDLPAMDDDDLRRGRPTNHKVFGEALAILAGDALNTYAFEVLLDGVEPADVARDVAWELAHAAGPRGMVGGQVEDVQASGRMPDEEALRRVQGGKTAALIRAACRGGARIGGGTNAEVDGLGRYGTHLGFAFQMIDDVLDVVGTAEALGKTPGKDAVEGRLTWVSLAGVDGARERAEAELGWALQALEGLPGAALLGEIGHLVTNRDR